MAVSARRDAAAAAHADIRPLTLDPRTALQDFPFALKSHDGRAVAGIGLQVDPWRPATAIHSGNHPSVRW